MGSVRRSIVLAGAALPLLSSCLQPAGFETFQPKEPSLTVHCSERRDRAPAKLLVDVGFPQGSRNFAITCDIVPDVVARLQTVEDFWCEGLAVPAKTYGDVTVSTTASALTGKRGATLDQGEGYVAFHCGDWLRRVLDEAERARCCRGD